MFPVFKKFLNPLGLFVFVFLSAFSAMGKHSTPLSLRHNSETRATILDSFHLTSNNTNTQFEIMFIDNHGEPYTENIKIMIATQLGKKAFKKIDRRFGASSPKQYCSYDRPFIKDQHELAHDMGLDPHTLPSTHILGRPGDYIVLPVFSYSDQLGECDKTRPIYELYSVEATKEVL